MHAGWEVNNCRIWLCFSLLYLGELAELARRVPGYVQEAERLGDRFASVSQRIRLSTICWLVEDNPRGAAEDLQATIASWLPENRGFLIQHFYALTGRGEIALYLGQDYLDQVRGKLRAFRRAFLHRVPIANLEVLHLLGRTALARAATDRSARARWLAEVHALVRQLERQRLPLAHNLARLLEAGASFVEGNLPRTVAALRRALADLEASETMLYATAARRRLGETLGALASGSPGLAGDEGMALIAQADAWYSKQGVKNPARMTAMLVPGWPHPDWPHPDRPPPAPRRT